MRMRLLFRGIGWKDSPWRTVEESQKKEPEGSFFFCKSRANGTYTGRAARASATRSPKSLVLIMVTPLPGLDRSGVE